MSDHPPVCDYEGSDYRTRFWEGQNRNYEDLVERVALRHFLPQKGDYLLDIGAGFGRLADEYANYNHVVLFDYSRSLLREAQEQLKGDPRFSFVAGNWYQLPFVDGRFDTLVQVRTIHHAAEVPNLFQELARIARPGGNYILEFANKKNLKAILRYLIGRQDWSPFSPEPVEFVSLNFNFNAAWIRKELGNAGFLPGHMRSVSHYRIPLFKKLLPTQLLVKLDTFAQPTGNLWQLSPSVFLTSRHRPEGTTAAPNTLFACPTCRTPLPHVTEGDIPCPNTQCESIWSVTNNLYDFKEPRAPQLK